MHGPSPFLPGQLRFQYCACLTGSDDILCPRPDHLQKAFSIFFKLELSHTGNFQHSILICRFFDTHLHKGLIGKYNIRRNFFFSRYLCPQSAQDFKKTLPALYSEPVRPFSSLFSSVLSSPLSPVLCHLHCKCLLPCNQCFRLFSQLHNHIRIRRGLQISFCQKLVEYLPELPRWRLRKYP